MPLAPWLLGLDVGQAHDSAALAIVQRDMVVGPVETHPRYQLRHLERFPLGTPYSLLCAHQVPVSRDCTKCPTGVSHGGLVERVAAYIARLPVPTDWATTGPGWQRHYRLLIDATGVGRPVVELFQVDSLAPITVVMTHGNDVVQHAWNYYTVPKRNMVAAFQVTLQQERFRTPDEAAMPMIRELIKEAMEFKYRITANMTDQYGAWRNGQHDDLLFALMLTAWYGEAHKPHPRTTMRSTGFAEGAGNPLDRMGERVPETLGPNPFTAGRF